MSDKKKMPADGGGVRKGMPDGVSGSPDQEVEGLVHGRSGGGESGGGAYPNPHSDEGRANPTSSGGSFSGGQGDKAYYGSENPNATTPRKAAAQDQQGAQGSAPVEQKAHSVEVGGRTIEVIEDNGVAAAEATGKVATDAPYKEEQESPGGG